VPRSSTRLEEKWHNWYSTALLLYTPPHGNQTKLDVPTDREYTKTTRAHKANPRPVEIEAERGRAALRQQRLRFTETEETSVDTVRSVRYSFTDGL